MVNVWQPLPWQQDLWLELTAQALSGRLHHALLLTGPQGVGKRQFARALTAFLLCEQRSGYACGQCRSCQQLAAGTQANASWLGVDGHLALFAGARPEQALAHWEPDKDSKRRDIAIDAVRSLIGQLTLTTHRGQSRAVLVEPAEKMSVGAVNAFLKTIEEPPAGTHLLLVSEQPALLRPTLRSRCQRLRFPAPAAPVATAWLREQGCRDAEQLLEAAHGAPLRAQALHADSGLQQQAQWQEWLQNLAAQRADPLGVAADIGKADAARFLAWLTGWLVQRLRDTRGQQPALARFASVVAESQRRLDGNAKPELVLDALMIQWWNLNRPRKAA